MDNLYLMAGVDSCRVGMRFLALRRHFTALGDNAPPRSILNRYIIHIENIPKLVHLLVGIGEVIRILRQEGDGVGFGLVLLVIVLGDFRLGRLAVLNQ